MSIDSLNGQGNTLTSIAVQGTDKGHHTGDVSKQSGQINGNQKLKNPEQALKSAVEQANKRLVDTRTRAEYRYDEKAQRVSIKIFDEDTNEVIKEVPSEDTLRMIEKLVELSGILVDERR
ncbi:flagellar protein FlaG protein [Lachnospiraceae bacterium KM106-2]|nr:flagellar protein FlaG protein [Lachnospiraceae bacterium KM106-2]